MGASQSRSDTDEKVFYSDTPIQACPHLCFRPERSRTRPQFSADVVNHLADNVASPEPTPERQASIDAQIRSRIHSELEHLRQEEDQVREEIERALEKENLDKERAMAGDEGEADAAGGVKSSAALMGDLEEVRQKIERFQSRRALTEFPEVQAKSDAVVNCYRRAPTLGFPKSSALTFI